MESRLPGTPKGTDNLIGGVKVSAQRSLIIAVKKKLMTDFLTILRQVQKCLVPINVTTLTLSSLNSSFSNTAITLDTGYYLPVMLVAQK